MVRKSIRTPKGKGAKVAQRIQTKIRAMRLRDRRKVQSYRCVISIVE